MDLQHRITGEVYFITDAVVDWVDSFSRPSYRHIIIESLQHCQKQKGLMNDRSIFYDTDASPIG